MARVENLVSVCRWLPSPDNETAGVFVLRRLEAVAKAATVQVIQPIPFSPIVRPIPEWARQPIRRLGNLQIFHEHMFYIPKILKSLDGYWLYRAIVNRLRLLHAQKRLDAVDAHFGYPDGVGASLAARSLGVPYFLTFRGLEADYIEDRLVRPQLGNALRYAAGCICVSHYLRELAIRYGAAPGKVIVIHNAIDRRVFCPGSQRDARAALGLPPDARLVVSVGHLLAVKGHHTLIEAFSKVRASFRDAQLAIVGGAAHEPDYPNKLKDLVRAHGLADAVKFVGTIPPQNVALWLRAADIFALATQREGCCNAVLEALAVGTPVVTTPAGDNAYFVKDDHNGYLVPIGDSTALAARTSDALRRAPWDAGTISRTLPVGEWAEVAKRTLDFFDQQLHRGARQPDSCALPPDAAQGGR